MNFYKKIYINIFEIRSSKFLLPLFGNFFFFGTNYQISSVSDEKIYNIFACIERYRSHGSFGKMFILLLTDEYLAHTVLNCKVIDPQATTLS